MANVKPTKSGNGVFSKQVAERPHLLSGHGTDKELGDTRLDISAALAPDAAMTMDEWDAPAGGSVLLLGSTPVGVTSATFTPVLHEYMDGAAISPATGTLGQTSGVWHYTPAAAPDGTHKYAIVYMADGTKVADATGTVIGKPGTLGVGSPKQ